MPYGVATDKTGNVYVADAFAVKEILAVNGSIPASPTMKVLGSGFNRPFGAAVDGGGNVYLLGNRWCGSGGCHTLVLKRKGVSWSIVTKIRIARTPIRVMPDMSNGWHSIGVWVQGGGVQPGYEAELRFNGASYSREPLRRCVILHRQRERSGFFDSE